MFSNIQGCYTLIHYFNMDIQETQSQLLLDYVDFPTVPYFFFLDVYVKVMCKHTLGCIIEHPM
jgi:hypothetical protein